MDEIPSVLACDIGNSAIHLAAVQGDQVSGKAQDLAWLGKLVVLDDVARLARRLEVVVDEGRGLEHQAVAQRAGHDEDARV